MKAVVSFFRERYGEEPEFVAVAPGRIEFIGNHTDYNGGPVMGLAVDRVIGVALSRKDEPEGELATAGHGDTVVVPLSDLKPVKGEDSWVNYPLGVYKVMRDAGMAAKGGFRMAVASTLPPGAGLSSSAAFELSSAYAYAAAYDFEADKKGMAKLGRKAENDFVGVPCGLLDQGVSAFGEEQHLVAIDCKTEEFSLVPLQEGVHFWVFNTQKKHALTDSFYADRHRECMDAYAVLKTMFPDLDCLADASLEQLEAVSAELTEAQLKRARHVVTESMRVHEMAAALAEGDLTRMGNLLSASHASSRHDFENSCAELDFLVDALRGVEGVWGCRLTGGGFGGAVMAVTNADFTEANANAACEAYAKAFGHRPTIFHTMTGDGARLVSKQPAQA